MKLVGIAAGFVAGWAACRVIEARSYGLPASAVFPFNAPLMMLVPVRQLAALIQQPLPPTRRPMPVLGPDDPLPMSS